VLAYQDDPGQLDKLIEAIDDEIEMVSLGRQLEIAKQVGSPRNLEASYGISAFTGSHGIGHTRLSTESKIDLSHSQPFWAHGCPDLAIVHNGHITNYHKMRRRYEQQGIHFYTENDSEIIGIYLGLQLGQGKTLREAMEASMQDLDGSFCYLAATPDVLGFAKDPFALKPLLFTETDSFVAIATEEIAMSSALEGSYLAREAQARDVQIWQR
jgi:glutamine phosphoribosylpyrophosphate amidotransferase